MAVHFEHTHQLSEREYVAIWALTDRAGPLVWARRFAVGGMGVLFLFSAYTLLLGVAVLALTVIGMTMPHWIPGTSSRTYRSLRYLRGPITYGADAKNIWVRGQGFFAEVEWHHVTVWREREGWLVLQGVGFPPVLLPTAALQREGLYSIFKALAQQHAVEYDGAAARRQAV